MPRARLVNGIEIEFELRGSGRPLLLIGGLGSQLISWDEPFCDALAASGYAVIRYDNRDSGLSTILDDRGVPDLLGLLLGGGAAAYDLEDMAADALGLLDHLGIEQVDLLGLSLGGMIAQLVAMREPARVRSVVAALSGPPGRPVTIPSAEVADALLRHPGHTFEERVDAAVDLRRALAGDGSGFNADEARRRAEAQIRRAYQPAGTMRQAAAILATPNQLAEMRRIEAPAMIVHGELDPLVPFESAKAAAAAIPSSVFVGIPGLGHDLPSEVAVRLIERISAFHSARVAHS